MALAEDRRRSGCRRSSCSGGCGAADCRLEGERIRKGERIGEQNDVVGSRARAGGEIDELAESNTAVLAMPREEAVEEHGDDVF
jgi:hypothetical protein